MSHGVEGEEVVFADAIGLAEKFEAGFQDSRLGVLEGYAYAEHRSSVVVVEIYTFRHLPPRDAEQDGAATVAACRAVGLESQRGLLRIGRFDENEFVFPDLVESAHALPHADDGFHVQIGGKEDDDAVGGELAELH